MVLICSTLVIADKLLAKVLYANDFYMAWKYVPWLSIAMVFGALSGYMGGFFSAVKNSKIFAQSTIIGAGVNIVLNLILTPVMGALGAAIATTVCYFVTWVFRYLHSKKIISMKINIMRDVVSYAVLVVQAMALIAITDDVVMYFVEMAFFVFELILYYKDIKMIMKKVIVMLKKQVDIDL